LFDRGRGSKRVKKKKKVMGKKWSMFESREKKLYDSLGREKRKEEKYILNKNTCYSSNNAYFFKTIIIKFSF